MKNFEALGLTGPILRALEMAGYETPTPIQSAAIPEILDGADVLGAAQTGTGKTAAFALPILQILMEDDADRGGNSNDHQSRGKGNRRGKSQRKIRALVLSPTRELSAQIESNFRKYEKKTHLRSTVIFGGVNQNPQIRSLNEGVDVLVATPGRLLDLVGQGFVSLSHVEMLVLDEADHMLDMGFLPDMKRILKLLPKDRQNLMFSATMPGPIRQLADEILIEPVSIQIAPKQPTVERIEQSVCYVEKADKPRLLAHYLDTQSNGATLVFTRTKHGADAVAKRLVKIGLRAKAIHGNKTQSNRQRTLDGFKNGSVDILVATDVAARGIDVDGVGTVINYDVPTTAEAYVHRIGRTGRAGREGTTIMFCGSHENKLLAAIQRHVKTQIPVVIGGPGCHDKPLRESDKEASGGGQSRGRRGGGGNRNQSGGGQGKSRGFRSRRNSSTGTGSTGPKSNKKRFGQHRGKPSVSS